MRVHYYLIRYTAKDLSTPSLIFSKNLKTQCSLIKTENDYLPRKFAKLLNSPLILCIINVIKAQFTFKIIIHGVRTQRHSSTWRYGCLNFDKQIISRFKTHRSTIDLMNTWRLRRQLRIIYVIFTTYATIFIRKVNLAIFAYATNFTLRQKRVLSSFFPRIHRESNWFIMLVLRKYIKRNTAQGLP